MCVILNINIYVLYKYLNWYVLFMRRVFWVEGKLGRWGNNSVKVICMFIGLNDKFFFSLIENKDKW